MYAHRTPASIGKCTLDVKILLGYIGDMENADIKSAMRASGLTHQEAAALLGCARPRVSEALRVDAHGPIRRGLEVLVVAWLEMDVAERDAMRARLAEMRGERRDAG